METGRSGVEMQRVIEVGGETYLVQHPDPDRAWELGIQLTKIVGEPFAAMSQAADEAKVGIALQSAMKTLLGNIDPKATLAILKELFRHVEIQGSHKQLLSDGFKEHFRGRPGHILNVAAEVIEFQFEDFFAAIGDAIASVFDRRKKQQEEEAA